jgi:hypothetical protein
MMTHHVLSVMRMLETADGLFGIPLAVGGLILMVFGLRLWPFTVAIAGGVAGYGLATFLCKLAGVEPGTIAVLAGVAVAAIGYLLRCHSITLVAALLCAGVVHAGASAGGAAEEVGWLLAVVGAAAGAGLAIVYRQHVAILLASLEGGLLLLAGLTVFVSSVPSLYAPIRHLVADYPIMLCFVVLVPVSMGCFFLAGEAKRNAVDLFAGRTGAEAAA